MTTHPTVMPASSAPSSSNQRHGGHPSTTVTELVISEAHYLSTLKRVGNALNLASNQTLVAGRKGSNTTRILVERWAIMMRIHIKFHDDIAAIKEDVQGAAKLLQELMLTLEPVLVEHGRELASVVYKLDRSDKRSGHMPSEWDITLRHPFDHLTVYNEWLQRIDPQGRFNGDGLSQLNTLVLHVKSALESNPNPRGVLKRISTFARGVMKRPSSMQTTNKENRGTIVSANLSNRRATTLDTSVQGTSAELARASPDLSQETVAIPAKLETVVNQRSSAATATPENSVQLNTASRTVETTPGRHPSRKSITPSDMSSIGSLTLAPSSESLNVKAHFTAKSSKSSVRPPLDRQASTVSQRQIFLEEREARKASLRMGAQAFIAAQAESLQKRSPRIVSRPSIDRLRTITKREANTKPPVKSLINFWEQAVEPIEV
ncbi:hypothetical protein BG011_009412 [Mortierella polycephala]|uniref:DH domain-containing protein n=1 Tax=Mortierella polycephala TaxID=41804 RepID=A0A9P6QAP8_9FUNG|nr:hypothetical protein BG011_009412 [Mortierella polycephala]